MLSRRAVAAGLLAAPALLRLSPARAAPASDDDAVPAGTVLRVGDQKGNSASVLKAAGALAGVPYTVEWHQFVAAAPLLEALDAGVVDLAYAADAPTTFALAAGVEAKIIAANRGTGAGTAILVPDASPIRAPADLRGKRIAVNRGSIGHALVLAVAARQGWAPGDIEVANLLPADAKAALAAGAVDAWSTWEPYLAQAQLNDGARVLIDGGGGVLTGLGFVTATNAAIAGKRAALADYVRRLAGARRWALEHPDAYAAVLAAEIGVSPAVAKRAFLADRLTPVPIDDAVAADEQRTADRYAAAKLIPHRIDTAPAFDRGFNAAVT